MATERKSTERKTTVRDIAERAGVSAMTVSNVINGRPGKVRRETAELVRATMKELDFVPDASASALKSNRSNIIALVYPFSREPLANQHDAAFVGAVEHHVSHHGSAVRRHLMIWSAEDDDVARTADKLRTWRMDGAIFYGTFGSEVDNLHEKLKVPMVFVDNYSESPQVKRVGVDDRGGGVLAAEHLLDAGHRTLGFVGPLTDDVGVVRERYLGFTEAARQRVDKIHEFRRDPRFEVGRELAIDLSSDRERPTGLFATADILAIGLLNGFLASGIDVPRQVSLIGFDDIPEASHGVPGLTTIRQDVNAKAQAAVDRLVGLIERDPDPGGEVTLPVELVQRDTVGPPLPVITPGA